MKSTPGRTLWRLTVGALLIVPWAILLWSRYGPPPEKFYSDGISLRVSAAETAGRTIVWEHPEPVEVPGLAGADVFDPAFSPDGKSLVFTRGQPQKDTGLWISQRLPGGAGWTQPESLGELETPSDELGAAWDPGGARLYFVSNRPGGEGGYDIWWSEKTADGWAVPVNAGPSINSIDDEIDPAVTPAGDVLFFTSNRPSDLSNEPSPTGNPWRGTLRNKGGRFDFDIYSSILSVEGEGEGDESEGQPVNFEPAVPVVALNSRAEDGQVAFTPRGDFVYFASDRRGGEGGFDLYRARWRDGRFEPAVNLGEMVNSRADEMDPSLALEGFLLAFSSDRETGGDESQAGAPFGIFFAVSREVDIEENWARPWNLAALARFYEEWKGMLLWLLLALAGYWILVLVQRHSSAEPSLTQRCFAASLLVHAGLLALFTVWTLTEALLDEPQDPSMEVAINTESLAAEKLATEIRESVSSLPPVETIAHTQRFSTPPDFVAVDAPPLSVPDLPDAEAVERQPADPSFQVPETAETRPEPPAALPKVAMSDASSTIEFAMEELVLDTGQPALVEAEAKLKPPSDTAGTRQKPREAQVTPGKLTPEEVPALEAEKKIVAMPAVSVSQTPDRAGDFAPSAPAKIPAPLVEIALDPMAASGADLVPHTLEVRAAKLKDGDPESALAKISDALSVVRKIGLPESPPTESRNVATLPALENSDNKPGLPAAVLAATAERALLPSRVELPDTDIDSLSLAAMPQTLDPGALPKLESPVVPENPYLLRDPKIRDRVIEELGGSQETEKAIRHALDWFSRHQERDGHWNVQKFGGRPGHDVAATSLALLSYMGWGANHQDGGPYRDQVSRAVKWLLAQMKEDGDLRGWNGNRLLGDMYDQGMGVMALSEAFGVTEDENLRAPLEKAVAFIVAGQDPAAGSWRYRPFPQEKGGDTSIFGWQVMALRSAQLAGLDVPADALARCEKWLQKIGGGKKRGLYGYRDAKPKPAMVAEGLFSRQLLGTPAADPRMRESIEYLSANLPSSKQVFFYYWYYGQLALYQNKGPVWRDWNEQMKAVLLPVQHQKGAHAGSWDPKGQYGKESGRVVVTAMATLTLEVYYRYLPLYNAIE